MLEIRFHGRGGQGAKTASQLLAVAFLEAGRFVQAFPEYGPERTGAPMMAYTRVDERPIRLHAAISEPDVVVVLDPSLVLEQNVTEGLGSQGFLVVNSGGLGSRVVLPDIEGIVLAVPADELAEKSGTRHANTVMAGAVAALLGEPSLEQLLGAVDDVLARLPESLRLHNRQSVQEGYTYGVNALRTLDASSAKKPVHPEPPPARDTQAGQGPKLGRAGALIRPGDYPVPLTGGWRMGKKPAVFLNRCVNCLLCWQFCPDGAVVVDGTTFLGFDYAYCKGCEICDAVCPTKAVVMIDEEAPVGSLGQLKEVSAS